MNHLPVNAAVVVAAGKSRRMGGGHNKVFNLLANRPVLCYSLDVFQSHEAIHAVVIVGREDDREAIERLVDRYCPKAQGNIVIGGAERFDSVRNGLRLLKEIQPEAVLIQDAARPFLRAEFIQNSLSALNHFPGAIVGVPLKDTLKETQNNGVVITTHERSRYWLAQTPQTFRYSEILEAYEQYEPPPYPTDDGAVLEEQGLEVTMVEGSYDNMKITTPEDIVLAEAILQSRSI